MSPTFKKILWLIFAVCVGSVVISGILIAIYSANMTDEEKRLEEIALKARSQALEIEDKRKKMIGVCIDNIKFAMHNPDSFDFVKTEEAGQVVKIIYRGTNKFNAVVTEEFDCPMPFK